MLFTHLYPVPIPVCEPANVRLISVGFYLHCCTALASLDYLCMTFDLNVYHGA